MYAVEPINLDGPSDRHVHWGSAEQAYLRLPAKTLAEWEASLDAY